jgi:hypothetical protein
MELFFHNRQIVVIDNQQSAEEMVEAEMEKERNRWRRLLDNLFASLSPVRSEQIVASAFFVIKKRINREERDEGGS